MLQRTASLAGALALFTACNAEPFAPHAESAVRSDAAMAAASETVVTRDEGTVPASFLVYVPCANGGEGEVVHGNGQLQYRGHWITTTHGQRQHNFTLGTFTGSATGWETGEVYDVSTRDLFQTNTYYGDDGILDSGEELQRIRIRLTSRATGAGMYVVITGRFVLNPAGEYVVDSWDGTSRCE
jgi:hypothetical protein